MEAWPAQPPSIEPHNCLRTRLCTVSSDIVPEPSAASEVPIPIKGKTTADGLFGRPRCRTGSLTRVALPLSQEPSDRPVTFLHQANPVRLPAPAMPLPCVYTAGGLARPWLVRPSWRSFARFPETCLIASISWPASWSRQMVRNRRASITRYRRGRNAQRSWIPSSREIRM